MAGRAWFSLPFFGLSINVSQDAAFLDRVDIKQFIPQPSARVIYEIYKSCLEDLARCGIVEGSTFDVIQLNPADPQTPLQYVCQPAETLILPGYDEMLLAYQMFSDSIPKQLADVASASVVSRVRSRLGEYHLTEQLGTERSCPSKIARPLVGSPYTRHEV